jgi:hypothetical protein
MPDGKWRVFQCTNNEGSHWAVFAPHQWPTIHCFDTFDEAIQAVDRYVRDADFATPLEPALGTIIKRREVPDILSITPDEPGLPRTAALLIPSADEMRMPVSPCTEVRRHDAVGSSQ